MFVRRSSSKTSASQRASRHKKKGSSSTNDALFDLDAYLTRRDYAGALTLLRVLRRRQEDLPQSKVADEDVTSAGTLGSWRLNTWWVAYCHFQLGDVAQALALLDQLLQASNENAGADSEARESWKLSRACCLYYLQSLEEAEHAALGSPRGELCNRLLFLIAHRREHGEQALLNRYQQLSRSCPEDQLALAATSFARRNFQEALEIYKRLVAEAKDKVSSCSALHVYLALCYFRLDYYDVALELLAVYMASHPDSFFAANLKASCQFRLYSPQEAISVLDDFMHKYPSHPAVQQASLGVPSGRSGISAMADVMQHNMAVFRASDSDTDDLKTRGQAAITVLTPLVGQLDEAQTNLVLLYLKRREYQKAFALVEDIEPSTATERAVKAVLHGVIGEQTHSKEHVFLAEKHFHAAGASPEDADTIPGRQCMASYFLLRKEFSDANVYLNSIATYLSADDAFNWNYGISLASVGAFREAEELLLRVQSPVLQSQLELCGWLARCHIVGGGRKGAARAWELYLKMEDSQTAFALLKQIANDYYKAQDYFFATKAFDVLERLDPDPEYWEAKRGACLGFFRRVAIGEESDDIGDSTATSTLAHRCEEVLKLLGNSKNVLEASKLVAILRKWTLSFLPRQTSR